MLAERIYIAIIVSSLSQPKALPHRIGLIRFHLIYNLELEPVAHPEGVPDAECQEVLPPRH